MHVPGGFNFQQFNGTSPEHYCCLDLRSSYTEARIKNAQAAFSSNLFKSPCTNGLDFFAVMRTDSKADD